MQIFNVSVDIKTSASERAKLGRGRYGKDTPPYMSFIFAADPHLNYDPACYILVTCIDRNIQISDLHISYVHGQLNIVYIREELFITLKL